MRVREADRNRNAHRCISHEINYFWHFSLSKHFRRRIACFPFWRFFLFLLRRNEKLLQKLITRQTQQIAPQAERAEREREIETAEQEREIERVERDSHANRHYWRTSNTRPTCQSTQPLSQSFTHSFVHSFVHSFMHSLASSNDEAVERSVIHLSSWSGPVCSWSGLGLPRRRFQCQCQQRAG